MATDVSVIERLPTGIPGFDHIANGGLPRGRTTLVSGTAGSAKTVFASQFLAAGVQLGEAGVFVTFEESPAALRRNMLGFGWNIAEWEEQGRWAFVDASPQADDELMIMGAYDLSALLARIEHAVRRVGATRVSMDSLGAIFNRLADTRVVRNELFRIVTSLKSMGLTAVITAERTHEYGDIGRYGVEEFVTDDVVILRNLLEEEKRRRTVEILKFRGTSHQKGGFPFTVIPGQGIVVIPLSAIELKQRSSNVRISSGSPELDRMCGGGFFRDSIILVSGATGTGKTLMSTTFMASGALRGERSLLFAFEESRDQLARNAIGWGVDFEQMEQDGLLRVVCNYPEVTGLEDQLISIQDEILRFRPQRVAIDSLSALERVSTIKGFREFVIGLTSFIKHQEMAGLYTSTTPTLLGGTSITEAHISTITDSIILLRYVELFGEMRRGLTVLKMRGSAHDKDIREFSIDGTGMHIGRPFRNISGILSGQFTHVAPSEIERLSALFRDEENPLLPEG
ncbi:circadian clock protein KaiC [Candidatus Chloroploca sp. Khr17]|uniref:circadian clock protein KaiC n=1 Tax=Candidatus Chloroploca sp. Khr17 TaxID=2496869 RepID=UPI0013EA56E3|nr:circadian clock protein KaiC [Candidatus Chloroploca sp. Khr17]